MARPSKLTPETQDAICKAIENGATYKDAAAVAGVSEETFRLWMKNGREATRKNKFSVFFGLVEAANAKCRAQMAESIYNAGLDGDWRAAESFLKRRDPDNWGDRQKTELDQKGEMRVIVEYAEDNPSETS
jgi:hypothetical protein